MKEHMLKRLGTSWYYWTFLWTSLKRRVINHTKWSFACIYPLLSQAGEVSDVLCRLRLWCMINEIYNLVLNKSALNFFLIFCNDQEQRVDCDCCFFNSHYQVMNVHICRSWKKLSHPEWLANFKYRQTSSIRTCWETCK